MGAVHAVPETVPLRPKAPGGAEWHSPEVRRGQAPRLGVLWWWSQVPDELPSEEPWSTTDPWALRLPDPLLQAIQATPLWEHEWLHSAENRTVLPCSTSLDEGTILPHGHQEGEPRWKSKAIILGWLVGIRLLPGLDQCAMGEPDLGRPQKCSRKPTTKYQPPWRPRRLGNGFWSSRSWRQGWPRTCSKVGLSVQPWQPPQFIAVALLWWRRDLDHRRWRRTTTRFSTRLVSTGRLRTR